MTPSPKERLRRARKAAKKAGNSVIVAWCDLALHATGRTRQEAVSELVRLGAFNEDLKSTDR